MPITTDNDNLKDPRLDQEIRDESRLNKAEVVGLHTATDENKAAAVLVLERMLYLAKQGQIASVACAFVKSDRVSVSFAWSGSDTVPALIGGLTLAQQDMAAGAVRERSGGR